MLSPSRALADQRGNSPPSQISMFSVASLSEHALPPPDFSLHSISDESVSNTGLLPRDRVRRVRIRLPTMIYASKRGCYTGKTSVNTWKHKIAPLYHSQTEPQTSVKFYRISAMQPFRSQRILWLPHSARSLSHRKRRFLVTCLSASGVFSDRRSHVVASFLCLPTTPKFHGMLGCWGLGASCAEKPSARAGAVAVAIAISRRTRWFWQGRTQIVRMKKARGADSIYGR